MDVRYEFLVEIAKAGTIIFGSMFVATLSLSFILFAEYGLYAFSKGLMVSSINLFFLCVSLLLTTTN